MYSDSDIIDLFFSRSESAIAALQEKCGKICKKTAFGILKNHEDAEECINTSYMNVWNSIPPNRPKFLTAYVCTVVRNCAYEIYNKNRRRMNEISLGELEWLIEDKTTVENLIDGVELSELINGFLRKQKPKNRKIFMLRYYFNMSSAEIGASTGLSEAAVKTRLSRIRGNLRDWLEENGVICERRDNNG